MKKVILLPLFFLLCHIGEAQSIQITLSLPDNEIKELFLHSFQLNGERVKVPGELKNNIWTFIIPDSVRKTSYSARFQCPSDSVNNEITMVSFYSLIEGDTMKFTQFTVPDHSLEMKGIPPIEVKRTGGIPLNINGKSVTRTICDIIFSTEIEKGTDLYLEASNQYFARFYGKDSVEVNKNLEAKYIKLVKENPDSKFLITRLCTIIGRYDPNVISKIYNGFSEKNKATEFGKAIEQYLNARTLINYNTL